MLMIADNLWNEISEFVTFKKSRVGRPMHDSKLVFSGIFYIMQTGAQWRNLPNYYGRKSTVHGRLKTLIRSGIFGKILNNTKP